MNIGKKLKDPKVAIIVGSESDIQQIEKTPVVLREFGVDVTVKVLSAHRTPEPLQLFVKKAEEQGTDVIIAAAGKAAALPGVIASMVTIPVVGIPIKSSFLDGMDSLLSIVQMPEGIPVGTVGISSAVNAALYAIAILSLKYPALKKKLADYRKKQAEAVIACNENKKNSR